METMHTVGESTLEPTVQQAMTPRPATSAPQETLRLAWNRMARGPFRHLPVMDAGRLVGIVTLWDICQGMALSNPQLLDGHPLDLVRVQAVMTRDPVVIGHERPLGEAAAILAEWQIGALPVVDENGRLVGIVTERDIVREYAAAVELDKTTEIE